MEFVLMYLLILPFVVCYDPRFTIKAHSDKGIKACIEEQNGMSKLVFHANINEEIVPPEIGEISGTVTSPEEGIWCFVDHRNNIKLNDRIAYWYEIHTKSYELISYAKLKIIHREYH